MDCIKRLFLLGIVLLACGSALSAQVTVSEKKVIYRRPKPIIEYKKTFEVTYPKVKAATPAISKKIEAALSYEKVFDISFRDEMNDAQWLEEALFETVYNAHNILCVELTIDGTAAYPSGSTKYVVIDTRNGTAQTPAMVFKDLPGLAAMVRGDQRREVAEAIKEIKADKDAEEPKPERLFTDTKFTVKQLAAFSVDAKGVTFHYDYGFPHVMLALQPDGEFFYPWRKIAPFIRPGGLLAPMAR